MILVLLGTQDNPFNRIMKEVSRQIKLGNIKERVVAQVGCTKNIDEKIESFDFCPKEKIEKLIEEARIVICHAGVGTIIECLNKNKRVIVVPRLKKYGEHANDHQVQITKDFESKGYIIPLYNIKKLDKALEDIKKFKPNKYESNTEKFKSKIEKYINML